MLMGFGLILSYQNRPSPISRLTWPGCCILLPSPFRAGTGDGNRGYFLHRQLLCDLPRRDPLGYSPREQARNPGARDKRAERKHFAEPLIFAESACKCAECNTASL